MEGGAARECYRLRSERKLTQKSSCHLAYR